MSSTLRAQLSDVVSMCCTCADLRYHPEHHVRCLAAETFGFLLRTAPRKSLRAGMRALLAEHAGTLTALWNTYCVDTYLVLHGGCADRIYAGTALHSVAAVLLHAPFCCAACCCMSLLTQHPSTDALVLRVPPTHTLPTASVCPYLSDPTCLSLQSVPAKSVHTVLGCWLQSQCWALNTAYTAKPRQC
jgi:hypothetical protein